MADEVKYLVTVEAETGAISKVEQMGDAGELTEVPASTFEAGQVAAYPPSYVVNIFMGGAAEGVYTVTGAEGLGQEKGGPAGVPNPRQAVPNPHRRPRAVPNPISRSGRNVEDPDPSGSSGDRE